MDQPLIDRDARPQGSDATQDPGRGAGGVPPEPPRDRPTEFSARDLLRWLYLGRMTLAAGILVGVLLSWLEADPADTRLATLGFLASLAVTGWSFFHTHVRGKAPGHNFLYAHVMFDVVLVTTIVHITAVQGGDSPFVPAYILVISEAALLLPLPGGVLLGALASIVYFADIVWSRPDALSPSVTLQIGLFALVAVVTGWVGDRVRRAGLALGRVQSELTRLRLSTSDILENISTGVMTVDADGRLLYVNEAGAALLGLGLAGWRGVPVLDRVEETAPGLGAVLRRTVEERRPMSRFRTVAQLDGRQRTLGVSTTVLERADGAPPSVTAIFQDITDLEQLEILNRRNERLEAVAELSASLAHEIKNPLASIRSAVEQLTRGSLEDGDREVLERLVVGESERLSRLLSEFLEFSGMKLAVREEVDFARIVRDALAVVRQHPEARPDVEIVCDGIEGALYLPGDEDLLHRLVFNLVLNAVQFAGEG
ncbi:MAG: PAS domain S-box protein, partial [Gemmatimonadetes bacterium]